MIKTHCVLVDQVSETEWLLNAQSSDKIEDWAILLDLSSDSPFGLSTGLTAITFELDGATVNSEADMLLSFLSLCCALIAFPAALPWSLPFHVKQHGIRYRPQIHFLRDRFRRIIRWSQWNFDLSAVQ